MMPVKSNLPFLPEEDSWLYVNLLAVSTALGVTYADLLKEFFINIEDKMNQFTEKGYLLFIINGEEYLYNAECTNGPIKPKELGLTADAIQAAYENKVTKIKEQLQKQNSANKINSMEVFK